MAVHHIIAYVFAGVFAVLAATGYFVRAKRVPLWLAAILAGSGAGAAWADAFWPMVIFGVLAFVSAFSALNLIDNGWRLRAAAVISATFLSLLALWPTFDRMSDGKAMCPRWVEDRVGFRLVAGLDLRGGLRLVYTVDVSEAIKDKRDRYYEDMRVELSKIYGLHSGDEQPSEEVYTKLRDLVTIDPPRTKPDTIELTVKPNADPGKIDSRFLDLFRGDLTFSKAGDGRKFIFTVRDEAKSSIRERAVGQAKEIILRRVDELGLREASVTTRDEDIIVEVPGEDEESFATIRDIISQTARLEFKLLDDETDYMGEVAKTAAKESLPEGLEFKRETAPLGLDDNGERLTKVITYAVLNKKKDETSQQAQTRMREWIATLEPPPDREIGIELERATDPDTLEESEVGWRTYLLKRRADITGDMVRDAQAMPDQQGQGLGGWHVQLRFTDQGGRIFDRITGANVQKRFAIILDNRVESTPVILTRISGGVASITLGSSDPEIQLRDARKLELVLRSGALPAPISPSNEQRIGPSLGADSIKMGVQGTAIGIGLVMLFLIVYYRRAGLIADVSALANVLLQLAVLATFNASMTLPGIAAIALTIGTGVDANVLFNERIREELDLGKSPRAAVELGFSRALSAIVDGQITLILSAVVLAQYGTGPIKGFAVTLIVGAIVNLFTSIVFSRVMFDLWVRGMGRKAKLDLG